MIPTLSYIEITFYYHLRFRDNSQLQNLDCLMELGYVINVLKGLTSRRTKTPSEDETMSGIFESDTASMKG